ncbi:MAG: DNA mismatch repair protein MutS [Planctomycetes bacterium]|nr:DNA mismatch repair protein MutS [Planctomycetota bacterium]
MPSLVTEDPRAEYQKRLHDRQENVARLKTLDQMISAGRGLIFLVGIVLAIAVFGVEAEAVWWLMPIVILFGALVLFHGRVCDDLSRSQNAVAFYQVSLDRLDEQWVGHGATGLRYSDPNHLYSADLDLFGRGSLFQLISTARTRVGEDRLASWLLSPAEVETIRDRQAAVDELRNHLDLREKLAVLDAEVHDDLNQNLLRDWTAESPHPVEGIYRITAVVLAVAGVVALSGWLFWGVRLSYLVIVLSIEILLAYRFRKHFAHLALTADEVDSGLGILSQVLEVLEKETFSSPPLKTIRTKLQTEGLLASSQIARLHRLIQRLNNCLKNQFYAPVAFLLGLPVHLIHAIEMWRTRVGPEIHDWLEAVADSEALSSLAGYAYEHPHDPFPELVESESVFEGTQIGHPLIPEDHCVRNDVSLGKLQWILVSGSNMSGKSTLLRSVGINIVLALAGAPVRAERLRLASLQLGTAMRIHDSLQDGQSLFYAAVSRMKSIIDLTRQKRPVFFLLDEILMGTNSHDRRIGAEGVIRKLVECGAIGLMTTHDLELTKIVKSFDSRAKNVHFEDQLVDGRMAFDYRLREGVVQKSNALELMRMIGLDV